MIHSEAPDLQDITNGVGIEVTNAVRENDMKVLRLLSELRNQSPNPNRFEKIKEKIESCNHQLSSNNNIHRATYTETAEINLFFKTVLDQKQKTSQV